MKYDLFISDFDGTLGYMPNNIHPEDVQAIKEYIDKGGKFVICTGRVLSSIRSICLKYGLKGHVISYQGAMVNDIETGECLYSGGLDPADAIDIVKRLKAKNMKSVINFGDTMFYEERSEYVDFYDKAKNVKIQKVDSLIEILEKRKEKNQKVCGIIEGHDIIALIDEFNKIYDGKITCNSGSDMLIEFINPKCDKGFGVKFISEYYGIPFDKVIAVGDSTNDIELINGEWHGVAVGSAHPRLKEIADEVTVDFDSHPIATLLKKYCL